MAEVGATGYGLLWADEDDSGQLNPTWTATPDIPIIQELAAEHLSMDKATVSVTFLTEGAFNKLYLISSPSLTQRYLMRVALPVEPFFKTESEVATMAFLRKHTQLPAPRVIAYSSSADIPLRFEWILLEHVEGTPIADLWDGMSFDAKAALTIRVREHIQNMQSFSFTCIGNLYFSSIADKVAGQPAEWLQSSTQQPASDQDFVIGHLVSPWFFRDKRMHLNRNRGPFKLSRDLMLAMTDMQIERLKHLSSNPSDAYYNETDKYLAEHETEILETCNGLKNLVPSIFPPGTETEEQRVLYHHDISDANIILKPDSLELTRIVDWESVGILPSWRAAKVPHFLRGIEVPEPPAVGTPGVDEMALVEIRKDWEKVRLRQLFNEGLPGGGRRIMGDLKRKLNFLQCLEQMEERWQAARHWTPALADPGDPEWRT